MNWNGLISRILKIVLQSAARAGTDTLASRNKPTTTSGKQQSKQAREMTKRARQAARVTRRLGK